MKVVEAQAKKAEVAGKSLGTSMSGSFASIAKSIGGALAGYMAFSRVMSAATGLAKTALKNASDQAEANAKLQFLYGANAEALNRQAAALQLSTRFGDDQIQSAQFALGTYKLSLEAVEKLTPAILDMSQATGVDAESAAKLLGKAMSGNVGVLGRYGIALSDTQKAILQTGTEEQKVAVITDELGKKFGGVAEAMATTVPGAWIQTKNAFGEMLESFGMGVEGSERVRVGLSALAKEMIGAANTSDGLSLAIDDAALGFINAAVAIAESINPLIKWGGVAKNVTDMAITISTLNFGKVFALPDSIKNDWAEMQAALSSDTGNGIAASMRKIRDEMAAVQRGAKSGVMPRRPGAFGGFGSEAGAGKGGAAGAGGDTARASMGFGDLGGFFGPAQSEMVGMENVNRAVSEAQITSDIQKWDRRDDLVAEHAKKQADIMFQFGSIATDGISRGLADAIVDGQAN
jgi:hypothetical protein